jgi:hypothetical protein
MAIKSDFNSLGDILLRQYATDFIAQMSNLSAPVGSILEQNKFWDLEKVLKECDEILFEDLLHERRR